jgi:tetratricopeptide (TPR) repeat protein
VAETSQKTGVMGRARNRLWSAAGSALCLAIVAGGLHAQQAKIQLKSGKDKTVMIVEENYIGVRGTDKGAESLTKWKDIDSIRYIGGEKFHDAVDTLQAGKAAEAMPKFEALLADDKLRPPLRQGALYNLGLCSEKLGKADDAIARYETLLKEFPKSRYLLPAGSNLLSIYLAKGDVAKAATALEPSFALAKDASADPGLQAGLGLLRGRLLEEQKKFDEAQRVFESAANATEADPDVIVAAKLGLARCSQKRGDAGDAERKYRELTTADAPNTVLAGAWNGIADIEYERATPKRDADGLRVAMLDYLRGVVLYVPGPEAPSEEYERALAGAAKAAKGIGELESNAERKKIYLDRAKRSRDQLATEYPGSRYLKGI